MMDSTYSCLFFLRIGVVETEVGLSPELIRQSKIKTNGLGVADMKVAVGLGWKAGLNDGVAVGFVLDVVGDLVVEEVIHGADFGAWCIRALGDSRRSWVFNS